MNFEIDDTNFRENVSGKTNPKNPLVRILFLRSANERIDLRHGIPCFAISMKPKNEDRTYPNVIDLMLDRLEFTLHTDNGTRIYSSEKSKE